MLDYQDQREKCVAAFDGILKRMVAHRGERGCSDVALVFYEDKPDGDARKNLVASRTRSLAPVLLRKARLSEGTGGITEIDIIRVPARQCDQSSDSQSPRDKGGRYLQFALMKKTFYMDLPRETLFPDEAQRLLKRRSGFFQSHERRWWFMSFESWQEVVQKHDPVQKEYLNGDTRSAAEDMAFVWYDLWKFPLDWRLYYKAFQFHGRGQPRPWEGSGSID